MGQGFEMVEWIKRKGSWGGEGWDWSLRTKQGDAVGKGCVNNIDDIDGRAQASDAQGKAALVKQQESVEPN